MSCGMALSKQENSNESKTVNQDSSSCKLWCFTVKNVDRCPNYDTLHGTSELPIPWEELIGGFAIRVDHKSDSSI